MLPACAIYLAAFFVCPARRHATSLMPGLHAASTPRVHTSINRLPPRVLLSLHTLALACSHLHFTCDCGLL